MDLAIYQVDAFTTEPFKGNPAGVVITQQPLSETLMRAITREMAVSETAFLTTSDMRLRWFTPEIEVKLCGHGTLATVQIMAECGLINLGESVCFNTLSGPLHATLTQSGIELNFPIAHLNSAQQPDLDLVQALCLTPDDIVSYHTFDSKQLIEVISEHVLNDLSPNFDAMRALPGRGVVVTAQSSQQEYDVVSRYFAPWVGVNEDPVTGSAHCALAPYWAAKLGRSTINAYQASTRGGEVMMTLQQGDRVILSGSAVTMIRGNISV